MPRLLFPAPVRPTMPQRSPAATRKVTPRRAGCVSALYRSTASLASTTPALGHPGGRSAASAPPADSCGSAE